MLLEAAGVVGVGRDSCKSAPVLGDCKLIPKEIRSVSVLLIRAVGKEILKMALGLSAFKAPSNRHCPLASPKNCK